MEIIAQSGVGSYSACDISNKVKPQTAALGFRVKSGWAAVVLLTGSIASPALRDNRIIDLSDPRVPETRQPYHAAIGKLETNIEKINRRVQAIRRITEQATRNLLADYLRKGHPIGRAVLVVGSQIDPVSVANPHIRAHAFEGQLFRSALEQALQARGISTAILLERDAYATAAAQLKKSTHEVRETVQNFRRFAEGPWRGEQKLAALAAWIVL
jgi:hypothetical protein